MNLSPYVNISESLFHGRNFIKFSPFVYCFSSFLDESLLEDDEELELEPDLSEPDSLSAAIFL